MHTRTLADLAPLNQIRYPADNAFRSARFLTAADGLAFSYNENKISRPSDLTIWLKHHWEANYILQGRGRVSDLTCGQSHALAPGTLYVVGPNDRHRLELAAGECHLSIFSPPLKGDERFDEEGAYEPSGPIPQTDRRMFVRHAEAVSPQADGEARTRALLTPEDAIGFTLTDIRIAPGGQLAAAAEPHGAAYHILSGSGAVSAPASGQTAALAPSMLVAAEPGEALHITARSEFHLVRITPAPEGP